MCVSDLRKKAFAVLLGLSLTCACISSLLLFVNDTGQDCAGCVRGQWSRRQGEALLHVSEEAWLPPARFWRWFTRQRLCVHPYLVAYSCRHVSLLTEDLGKSRRLFSLTVWNLMPPDEIWFSRMRFDSWHWKLAASQHSHCITYLGCSWYYTKSNVHYHTCVCCSYI